MERLVHGIQHSAGHKAVAAKFLAGWIAFILADSFWLDELTGWLKFTTHVFLAGGAALSFLFWLRRLRRTPGDGDSGADQRATKRGVDGA